MKNFSLSFLIFLLSITAYSQTYISGFIAPNTTWSVGGSPYIVTGNALLMQGDTLTIDPGVTVKFDTGTTLQIDGCLIAIGTDANRITFTSNQAIPQAGDWDELHFSDFASDVIYDGSGNYVSGCILKYCDVLYGGNNTYGLIHVESSSPYISHCTLQHSNSSGLYSNNATSVPDSSTINDCKDYGIYFTGCGVNLINDSITNSQKGGMYLNTSCAITIRNSYFYNDAFRGAIYSPNELHSNIVVTNNYFDHNSYDNYLTLDISIITLKSDSIVFDGNYFTNNSYSGVTVGSMISFDPPLIGQDSISTLRFTNTYVSGNTAVNGTFILFANHFHTCVMRSNAFVGNSVGDYTSAIAGVYSCDFDTIECNLFQNNLSGNNADGVLSIYMQGKEFISKNIFEGNQNNSANPLSVARINCISGGNDTCFFVNNTIRNNSSPSGPCIEFHPHIVNQKVLQIHDNNFENNIANGVVKLTAANTGSANLDFLNLKNNNFADPNSPFELYNNIPYGSPNVYADSNFWNGTSNQHLDSVIYDYFDNGNLSVVFYQPVLTSAVNIDTVCSSIATGVNETSENASKSFAYPNPFSNYTVIVFENELSDGTLAVFNGMGQEVKRIIHLDEDHVILDRENLKAGIYFYHVTDRSATGSWGKLIIGK